MNELSYLFMIMGNLADAKAKADPVAIADSVADLEMIAMHFDQARIRRRAAAEVELANAFLADLQAKRFGYAGPKLVMTERETEAPANLN